MSQAVFDRNLVVDWLTVVAIAATAIRLTAASHEGVHSLTCYVVGNSATRFLTPRVGVSLWKRFLHEQKRWGFEELDTLFTFLRTELEDNQSHLENR